MQLTSTAFSNGGKIPRLYTCDGDDLSPPLHWTDPPAETRSFVLLCDDPDAPGGVFRHWAAYDIPATRRELVENAGKTEGFEDFRNAISDFGNHGYGGPCPPRGHGPHRYHFRLLALDCPQLSLGASPSFKEVEAAARTHVLAEATLVGIYGR